MNRRTLVLFGLVVAVQAAALVIAAQYAASLGRTPERLGRWESTKQRLGVMNARRYMESRATLRRGHLDLGRWHGFQELWTRRAFKAREVAFSFRLDRDAYVCFLFARTPEGSAGLRLSVHPRFPSLFFRARDTGEFVETVSFDAAGLEARRWTRVRASLDSDGIAVRLDDGPLQRFAIPLRRPSPVGFRGSRNHVLVDDVEVREAGAGRVWRERFSIPGRLRDAMLAGAALLALLNALAWWLLRRARARQPGFVMLAWSLLLFFAAGALALVDVAWLQRRYGAADHEQERVWVARHLEQVRRDLRARYGAPPAAGTRRVVFLGSSQTFGSAAAREEETFVRVVERRLAVGRGDLRTECVNAGVCGLKAPALVAFLREEAAWLHPDLVVVNLSSNDDDPEAFSRALEELADVARERGFRLLFSLEANSSEHAPGPLRMHAVMRAVARRHAIPVVDPHAYLRREERRGLAWWDFVHPSSFGHGLIAECLAPAVRAALAR